MKQQVVVLGLLIIAVCVVSMIPFRGFSEGFDAPAAAATPTTATAQPAAASLPTTAISSNADFITAVNQALGSAANPAADKAAIQNLQSRIAGLTSRNSQTLLSEMGNPNNLSNPRAFLQYLNWFGSACPITSDTCSGSQ
jgi:hypothetical protein